MKSFSLNEFFASLFMQTAGNFLKSTFFNLAKPLTFALHQHPAMPAQTSVPNCSTPGEAGLALGTGFRFGDGSSNGTDYWKTTNRHFSLWHLGVCRRRPTEDDLMGGFCKENGPKPCPRRLQSDWLKSPTSPKNHQT